jgi:hypothetical protein
MTRSRNNVELSAVRLSNRNQHAATLPTTNGTGMGTTTADEATNENIRRTGIARWT